MFPNTKLSDPNFAEPSNIDNIIGIDLYEQVFGNGRTKCVMASTNAKQYSGGQSVDRNLACQ